VYRCVISYLSRVLINHATVLRDVVSNSSSREEAGWAMHTSLYTCRLNAALHMHAICLKNMASSYTALHPVSLRLLQDNDLAFNVFYHHLICLYFIITLYACILSSPYMPVFYHHFICLYFIIFLYACILSSPYMPVFYLHLICLYFIFTLYASILSSPYMPVFYHHLICLYFFSLSIIPVLKNDVNKIAGCLVDNLCTFSVSSFLPLHRAFCCLFNYTHRHMHIFFTCFDHVIIFREHTLFLAKVII